MAVEFVDYFEDAKIITHGGNFHADDIFCMALMDYLFDNTLIYRLKLEDEDVRKPLPGQIWFDIGGGKFDHHQKGGNGFHELFVLDKKPIPYASFGLIWREYGNQVCKKYYKFYEKYNYFEDLIDYAYKSIEILLARGIDACDNGIFPVKPDVAFKEDNFILDIRSITISVVISMLNPEEDDIEDSKNEGLSKAIYFAKNTIFTLFNRIESLFFNHIQIDDYAIKIDKKYKDIIYSELSKEFEFDNSKTDKSISNEFFPDNILYEKWQINKENCLEKFFGEDSSLAEKPMTSIVSGFCAEMEGIKARARGRYDNIYFATLKDVFGTKKYYSGDNYEQDFETIISSVLEKFLIETKARVQSIHIVKNAAMSQKGRILLLPDNKTYWKDIIYFLPEAQKFWFVVSQTSAGLWKVNPIRSKKTKNGYRKGFPNAWLGLRREELESRRNIYGVHFIHDSGLMALCDDKRSAIKLCKKAYGNTENTR